MYYYDCRKSYYLVLLIYVFCDLGIPFLQGVHPTRRVYKLVLTGGPCGGKTTGQAKLATFFENLGWKVFRVPETATVLMSGGIAFGELNDEQIFDFQVKPKCSKFKICT